MKSVKAKHGKKMIKLSVRFWTNDIAEEEGHIIPKHCHGSGFVVMEANAPHGIENDKEPFHNVNEIPAVIETLMKRAGMVVHYSR